MREGALRAALGNTPDTSKVRSRPWADWFFASEPHHQSIPSRSHRLRYDLLLQGLRKLRTSGLVVRRGHGGRLDPYRYMVKSAFASLSPEEQRALPPEDDGDAVHGDSGVSAEQSSGDVAGVSKEAAEQAAVVAGLDMAPCGAGALPEESADSSCDATLTSPATPMLAVWHAAAIMA